MRLRSLIIVVSLMILLVGTVFAQVVGVPTIPQGFTITLGQLPQPLPGQVIGNICPYEEIPRGKSVQVYAHEPSGLSAANLTYQFQIVTPRCEISYEVNFVYPIASNPVQEMSSRATQAIIQSIGMPSVSSPIVSGGFG